MKSGFMERECRLQGRGRRGTFEGDSGIGKLIDPAGRPGFTIGFLERPPFSGSWIHPSEGFGMPFFFMEK